MWIKICGNTNLDDCRRAADLGANAVGFVFAPGRRTVTVGQVAGITPHLPAALEKIGVFTTGSFHDILAAAHEAGLTGVQLHGPFAAPLVSQLHNALGHQPGRLTVIQEPGRLTVIQVLGWHTDAPPAQEAASFARRAADLETNSTADAVLVDSRTATASGGTGTTFDWHAARPVLARIALPVIAAGGLNPSNIADAIAALQPWGVDVASGVESAPGRKDPDRLAAFIRNARAAATASAADLLTPDR